MATPAREVERENQHAATLSPDDARWILARRTAEAIEGGRAAILRPEVRVRLLAIGQRLGLRPFDANLVIAIVQDEARCAPLSRIGASVAIPESLVSRIRLVRGPVGGRSSRKVLFMAAIAIMLGAAGALLGIWWLTSV